MADNYQIELTLDEIFGTGISSIEQTTVSTEPGGENIWTVTLTNGNAYNFTVFNGTAGGDPIPVKTASAMTDTSAVYLYLGTETGYTFGHWYYYDATWKDGGAYGAKGDKGEDGEDGADGFSPIATVTKSGTTTTISITDENGTTTAQVEDGVRPVVNAASVAGDMTDTDIIYVYVGETTASLTNGDWYFYDGEEWVSGGAYNSTALVTDKTLTQTDMAADAKKVGDEIYDLKSQINQGIGLTEDVKIALMNLVNHVGFDDDDPTGKTYIDALYDALYPPTNLSYITAVYSGGSVDEYASLDSLKSDLVVTAHYDDLTTETVTTYTLSGSLEVGTSTITVTYSGKTTTFDVTVTEGRLPNEYTEVEYLSASQSSSSNGAFIDTGVGFSSPTLATYRVGMQNASKSGMTEGQYFIGTRETGTGTTNNIGWGCQVYSTDKKTIISWAGSPGARFEPENQYEYHDIVATYKSTEVTIAGDDEEPVVLTQTMRAIGGYNIGIFGLPSNTGNGATYLFNGKIYYAQAEQDGVLLFDLIPCTRNADSKAGMWDRVSKTFLTATKAGSGSVSAITAGPAVSA